MLVMVVACEPERRCASRGPVEEILSSRSGPDAHPGVVAHAEAIVDDLQDAT
jgi:hypothetical protein